jgi:hypothetical protein
MSLFKKIISNFYTLALASFVSGLISVYDNVMNVIFYEDLPRTEQNPFASWLIEQVGVHGLVEIKALGTVLAVAIMLVLAKTKYKSSIWFVLLFQFLLFCYLTFYTENGLLITEDLFVPVQFFFDFYLG